MNNTIIYPQTLTQFKQLKKLYGSGTLSLHDMVLAESIITHWRQRRGAIALELLVKMSGKKRDDIASDLGIKSRQLSEMINGCNSLTSNMNTLCKYFNVTKEVFNYERQTRKTNKTT